MEQTIYSVLSGLILVVFATGCDSAKELVLSGNMVSHSECKSGARTAQVVDTPDSLTCIQYYFDASSNMLNLNHVNAGFNCCPVSLYCNITSSKDTIIIEEFEESSLCNCNCLYDLQIEVNGVKEGKYKIKLIEPYAGGMEPIVFEIDLKKETEGNFCIVRKGYPWGMLSGYK